MWQTFVSLGLFTWLVYVCAYCVPIATLNQRKLTQLRPNNYTVLKPWILILFYGLSVVWMDFLIQIYEEKHGSFGLSATWFESWENQPGSLEPLKTIFHPFSFS